jgi:ABC-type bacteriocin/lantibiotic exporter with double-glycine peptidase domain
LRRTRTRTQSRGTRESNSEQAKARNRSRRCAPSPTRFHQLAADPQTLAHQLGVAPGHTIDASMLLRAAKHLGLKARLSKSSAERKMVEAGPHDALVQKPQGV